MQDEKTVEFINKAKTIHGNTYDYSKTVYINIETKIIIICSHHGNFLQRPTVHLRGSGCRKCAIIKTATDSRSNTPEFIFKAQKIHGDRYDYSLVQYVNKKTGVIIVCSDHGQFNQKPRDHLYGSGCPTCCNGKRKKNTVLKIEDKLLDFTQRANKVHNNKYDYTKSKYTNSKTRVEIICPNHGSFNQKPENHWKGMGCPKCGTEAAQSITRSNADEYIEKAKKVHGNLYDYSQVDYVNSTTKIIIICDTHGQFEQAPFSHLAGAGCPMCVSETLASIGRSKTSEFIEKATKVHDNLYDYSDADYFDSLTPVIIICKEHGKFKQLPKTHLRGANCPKCMPQYSKKAVECLEYIAKKDNIFIQHAENDNEFRIPTTRYRADGYCTATNTVFEFHGCMWHGCIDCFKPSQICPMTHTLMAELYVQTQKKERIIKELGYNLVTIWEHDWDNKTVRCSTS